MIVCSCNVLTDRDVREALAGANAPRSTGDVYGCLGCSPKCGRCARTIRTLIDAALQSNAGCSGARGECACRDQVPSAD